MQAALVPKMFCRLCAAPTTWAAVTPRCHTTPSPATARLPYRSAVAAAMASVEAQMGSAVPQDCAAHSMDGEHVTQCWVQVHMGIKRERPGGQGGSQEQKVLGADQVLPCGAKHTWGVSQGLRWSNMRTVSASLVPPLHACVCVSPSMSACWFCPLTLVECRHVAVPCCGCLQVWYLSHRSLWQWLPGLGRGVHWSSSQPLTRSTILSWPQPLSWAWHGVHRQQLLPVRQCHGGVLCARAVLLTVGMVSV